MLAWGLSVLICGRQNSHQHALQNRAINMTVGLCSQTRVTAELAVRTKRREKYSQTIDYRIEINTRDEQVF